MLASTSRPVIVAHRPRLTKRLMVSQHTTLDQRAVYYQGSYKRLLKESDERFGEGLDAVEQIHGSERDHNDRAGES